MNEEMLCRKCGNYSLWQGCERCFICGEFKHMDIIITTDNTNPTDDIDKSKDKEVAKNTHEEIK